MSKGSIIILHGWKLSGARYNQCVSILKKDGYNVFAPDLPGFGKEPLVSKSMNLNDYVLFLKRFIKDRKMHKPILIGHSFGGRVAVKYAYSHPEEVSKLILTGVPIIRRKNFRQNLASVLAKAGNFIRLFLPESIFDSLRRALYRLAGSFDYYKAGSLDKIFINVISEDLTAYIKKIKIPTFLLWGKDDRLVPETNLKEIKKYMPQAVCVIFPGGGHGLPYDNPREFSKKVLELIKR